jgi:uncharacterized protein with GYD domain
MATFLMLGKYSLEAMKKISGERTEKAARIIEEFGSKVKSMYALLGEWDLIFIVDLPGIEEALKASVALAKMTGISFQTSPAMSVKEFDRLMA